MRDGSDEPDICHGQARVRWDRYRLQLGTQIPPLFDELDHRCGSIDTQQLTERQDPGMVLHNESYFLTTKVRECC